MMVVKMGSQVDDNVDNRDNDDNDQNDQNAGWLEPLLDEIARDPTRVVCPVIGDFLIRNDQPPLSPLDSFSKKH